MRCGRDEKQAARPVYRAVDRLAGTARDVLHPFAGLACNAGGSRSDGAATRTVWHIVAARCFPRTGDQVSPLRLHTQSPASRSLTPPQSFSKPTPGGDPDIEIVLEERVRAGVAAASGPVESASWLCPARSRTRDTRKAAISSWDADSCRANCHRPHCRPCPWYKPSGNPPLAGILQYQRLLHQAAPVISGSAPAGVALPYPQHG